MNDIFNQAVVYAYSSYFYFGGGSTTNHNLPIIARLDGKSFTWSHVGGLIKEDVRTMQFSSGANFSLLVVTVLARLKNALSKIIR